MKRRHTMMEGRSMKKVVLVATAVLLLGGAGAGAWYYYQANNDKKPVAKTSKEEQQLKEKLNEANTDDEKVKAYSDLSNHYVNSGDKDKAVQYAEDAVGLKASIDTYAQLAFAAEEAGDKQAAIAAYEKAASLSPKTSLSDARSDYSYYMGQAQRLKDES